MGLCLFGPMFISVLLLAIEKLERPQPIPKTEYVEVKTFKYIKPTKSIKPKKIIAKPIEPVKPVEDTRLKDLIWIKDTAFGVFKTRRFTNFKVMFPSYRTYRRFIDTSKAGAQSDVTQYAMYNNFWNSLRIQYVKFGKKSDKAGIEWAKTKLDSFWIDTGGIGYNEYAYLHWIVKFDGKRKYHLSALYLKMKNKWYLMDELTFVGLVVQKKRKKLKRKDD